MQRTMPPPLPVSPRARSASFPTSSPARAAATPDKPLLLFEDETWTYADAAREAWRAGNAPAAACGVEIGDYVSVWMPTGPDVLRAWFGANAAGARLRAAQPRRERQLPRAHAEARGVEGAGRAPPARRAARRARRSQPRAVVIVGGEAPTRPRRGGRSRSTSCSTARPTSGRRCRGRSSRGTTSA